MKSPREIAGFFAQAANRSSTIADTFPQAVITDGKSLLDSVNQGAV
jgi:hypothetical protein